MSGYYFLASCMKSFRWRQILLYPEPRYQTSRPHGYERLTRRLALVGTLGYAIHRMEENVPT